MRVVDGRREWRRRNWKQRPPQPVRVTVPSLPLAVNPQARGFVGKHSTRLSPPVSIERMLRPTELPFEASELQSVTGGGRRRAAAATSHFWVQELAPREANRPGA